MLAVLLVVAASGCPCVYAGMFEPRPDATHAATAPAASMQGATAPATQDAECPYCCCGRTQERTPEAPARSPKRPPCARRAHGEGLVPDLDLDIDLTVPQVTPAFMALVPLAQVVAAVIEETPAAGGPLPAPRPPDDLRRGIVLRN